MDEDNEYKLQNVPLSIRPFILPNRMHPHQMLSIEQYSSLRGISKDTTRREIKRGNIQAKKLSKRRIGIPAMELLK